MNTTKTIVLSLLTGAIAGFVFSKLSLPIPAPPNVDAFMGILGIWLGAWLIDTLSKRLRMGR